MTKRMRQRLRSPGVLVLAFTVLLAMSGLVWTHWTDTLEVRGQVDTGYIELHWKSLSTDDDGVMDTWELTPDGGGGTLLDLWGPLSSDDPAAPDAASRYDKDVARCWAIGEGSKVFELYAENVYPSYYCSTRSTFANQGTVPVMQQMLRLQVLLNGADVTLTGQVVPWAGGIALLTAPGVDPSDPFNRVAVWNTVSGTLCGDQFDPDVPETTANWFHVDEGAPQDATIGVVQELEFVNWNEYDPVVGGVCAYDITGTIPLGIQP